MNRFLKVTLISGSICLVLGAALVFGGVVSGGAKLFNTFVENGGLSFGEEDFINEPGISGSFEADKEVSHIKVEDFSMGELMFDVYEGDTITVEYENGKPKRIEAVVLSSQHDKEISTEELRKELKEKVIDVVLPKEYLDENTKYYINPTGRFEVGGPAGDSGLTGRKIIVDTYGGKAPHGGGAFSGKDPTKVDRSATYMARYVCKNVVASGLADECQVQLAYAIGVAHPVSVLINTFGTGKVSDEELSKIVAKEFDLRPSAIIEKLSLRSPVYKNTASYGHFGKTEFAWEKTDKVEDLKKYL